MIVFVRHAPTLYTFENKIQTYYDELDAHVTIQEYHEFIKLLRLTKIVRPIIMSSPMRRVQSTIKQLDLEPGIIDPRLEEVIPCKHDGMHKDEFIDRIIPMIDKSFSAKFVYEEIESFLNDIDWDQDYLVFTHGLRIKYFINYIFGKHMSFSQLFNNIIIKPLSLTVLQKHNHDAISLKGIYNL